MMKKQISELDITFKLLYFKLNQTNEIMEKRERQSLERHHHQLQVLLVQWIKKEKKFTKGESEDAIKTWSGEIEKHLEKANQGTTRV